MAISKLFGSHLVDILFGCLSKLYILCECAACYKAYGVQGKGSLYKI